MKDNGFSDKKEICAKHAEFLSDKDYISILSYLDSPEEFSKFKHLYKKIEGCKNCESFLHDLQTHLFILEEAIEESKKEKNDNEIFWNSSTNTFSLEEPHDSLAEKILQEVYQESMVTAEVRDANFMKPISSFSFQSKLHPSHIFLLTLEKRAEDIILQLKIKKPTANVFSLMTIRDTKKAIPQQTVLLSEEKNILTIFLTYSDSEKKQYDFQVIDSNQEVETIFSIYL